MRGRTNITQRTGLIYPNGDTKTFTVAEGNNIQVGDFVNYSIRAEEETILEEPGKMSKAYHLHDDMYVQLVANKLRIIFYNGMEFNIVKTYDDMLVDGFVLCEGKFVACSSGSDRALYVMDIIDDEFVILSTYDNHNNVGGNFFVYGSQILMWGYDSSAAKTVFRFFELIGDTISYITTGYYGPKVVLSKYVLYQNKIYGLYVDSASSTRKTIKLIEIVVDFTLHTASSDTIKQLGSTGVDAVITSMVVLQDRYLVCSYGVKIASSFTYHITVCDIVLKTYFAKSPTYYGLANYAPMLVPINDYDGCLAIGWGDSAIFVINESTKELERKSNVCTIPYTAYGTDYPYAYAIYKNNEYLLVQSPTKVLYLKYKNELLQGSGIEGFAYEYGRSGFTVGFAKTSGSAGDTIQVYVPHGV